MPDIFGIFAYPLEFMKSISEHSKQSSLQVLTFRPRITVFKLPNPGASGVRARRVRFIDSAAKTRPWETTTECPDCPLSRRSDAGFRCGVREGPLFSLHCKKCSGVRSVIKVPSFPSRDGKRRSGLSRTAVIALYPTNVRYRGWSQQVVATL